MSTLRVSTLTGTAGPMSSMRLPGNVVQTKVKRTDTPLAYTTGAGTGVEMTDLGVTITPVYSNSMIICFFQVHGEGSATHDYIYSVWKNGVKPTGTYAGFNTSAGDNIWSGISQALPYETDYSTTPFTQAFFYHDVPGVTTSIKYSPGIAHSAGSSQTFYVNRTLSSSTGASGQEVGISMSIAMEIAQ